MKKVGQHVAGNSSSVHPFDQQYGTDTSGIIQPWRLDIPEHLAMHAVQYGTALVDVFSRLLAELPIRHQDYVFTDLGSGKGRALLLASRFPFKRIIGVELSARLHQIACRNIRVFSAEWQKCRNLTSLRENAATFEIPGEHLIVYLFNPFDEQILRTVVSRLEESLWRSPRTIYVLYVKPVHRKVLDQSKWFELFKTVNDDLIYRTCLLAQAQATELQNLHSCPRC